MIKFWKSAASASRSGTSLTKSSTLWDRPFSNCLYFRCHGAAAGAVHRRWHFSTNTI